MQLLISHYWPGNVRELQNLIERGCALAAGQCWRPATYNWIRRATGVSGERPFSARRYDARPVGRRDDPRSSETRGRKQVAGGAAAGALAECVALSLVEDRDRRQRRRVMRRARRPRSTENRLRARLFRAGDGELHSCLRLGFWLIFSISYRSFRITRRAARRVRLVAHRFRLSLQRLQLDVRHDANAGGNSSRPSGCAARRAAERPVMEPFVDCGGACARTQMVLRSAIWCSGSANRPVSGQCQGVGILV